MDKTDILSLLPDELEAFLSSEAKAENPSFLSAGEIKEDTPAQNLQDRHNGNTRPDKGIPAYRAKQVFSWLHKGAPFSEMSNIPLGTRDFLSNNSILNPPEIRRKLVSKIDGTVKFLLALSDGQCIESVLMRYEHGNTVCVSSQAGCRMGCAFCASHLNGFSRNLLPSEMLWQVLTAAKNNPRGDEKINNIVIMGIGEPLDNFQNVIKFIKIASCPGGINISPRHISLSTCGLVDKIELLAKERLAITLSVSLHAADDISRDKIMPINKKWNIDSLMKACKSYFEMTGRRISFEYALISGVNDTEEEAKRLSLLLKKSLGSIPVHVNLIPLNEVLESGLQKSPRERVKMFADILLKSGINATVRRRLGPDINASCGQLRLKNTVN